MEAFWSKVAIRGGRDQCWEWQGQIIKGYGYFRLNGRKVLAHRLAFELRNKRPPVNDVLHSCDNKACVNPRHLRDGTHRENMIEATQRGRMDFKITSDDVRQIRRMRAEGERCVDIAQSFNITAEYVSGITTGRYRKHVTD